MIQKTGYSKIAALLAGATLMGLVAQSAFAVATPSNTNISNTATLSFSVGAVPQTSITSAAAQFVVDKKVDLSVVRNDASPVTVVPGQVGAVTKFTITNLGNDPQGMALTAAVATGTPVAGSAAPFDLNNITATGLTIYVDTNNNGVYDAGTDTAATSIASLPANGSQVVFVLSSIPIGAADTQQSVISLTALAAVPTTLTALTQTAGADSPMVVDTVFADGAGATDAARDGQHSAYDAYKVVSANLAVTKTVTPICDPAKGTTNPMNIPGALVQYAITVVNSGNAPATLTDITDTLVGTLAFDTRTITGAAVTCTVAGVAPVAATTTGFGVVTAVGAATTYAAPGAAADVVTAGATVTAQAITVNFPTLSKAAGLVLTAGALPAGSFITVYFNAFVQ